MTRTYSITPAGTLVLAAEAGTQNAEGPIVFGPDDSIGLLLRLDPPAVLFHGLEKDVDQHIARTRLKVDANIAYIVLDAALLYHAGIRGLVNAAIRQDEAVQDLPERIHAAYADLLDALQEPPPMSEAEVAAAFACKDCGVDTGAIKEYYMLTDPTWAATGLHANAGMLCIGCCEARIGRPLTPQDFADVPLKHIAQRSPRLHARIEGEADVDIG